jgi:hypothetical protein
MQPATCRVTRYRGVEYINLDPGEEPNIEVEQIRKRSANKGIPED